jgi:hypothetical protein
MHIYEYTCVCIIYIYIYIYIYTSWTIHLYVFMHACICACVLTCSIQEGYDDEDADAEKTREKASEKAVRSLDNAKATVLRSLDQGFGLRTEGKDRQAGPYSAYRETLDAYRKENEDSMIYDRKALTDRQANS